MTSFTSTVSGTDVNLNWATSKEINNSGFDIERSAIAGEWTKVGNVTGNGTTNETKIYSFTDKNLASGKYNYRLKQIDYNGNYEYFNLSNEIEIGVPQKFDLAQNYPNPFNPSTKINFALPKDGNIVMSVFDNSGRLVSKVADGFRTAGYYTVDFSAANLSSGVYFYKLEFNGSGSEFTKTMKMTVLK
ncbi:MAG: T9SS type A sorting domain-containing protein [Ignavibacteria bacterium]|nr:T9SS type A sorting domain-containing protein [Ignavibacteria bacterium]